MFVLPLQSSFGQLLPESIGTASDSFVLVPYRLLITDRYCYFRDTIIDTDSALQMLKEKCKVGDDSIDLDKQILIFRYVGGDCHARYKHQLYLDTARKKLVWSILNIYGGCRAGGGSSFIMLAPKPPEGYTVQTIVYLDDRDGISEDEWEEYWGNTKDKEK